MRLCGFGGSTMAVFLFVFILLPFGIIAQGIRPTWTKEEWATELESLRQKHFPDVDAGVDGRLPAFIECGLNPPVKMFTSIDSCDHNMRNVVLNEVLLRKQINSFNDNCNSHGSVEGELILNPPDPIQEMFGKHIDYRTYAEEWQDKLIDSKLQFCDPEKFLRCSEQKKCVCLSGSTWSPASDVRPGININTCAYFEDKACNGQINSLEGKYYFQLFRLRLLLTIIPSTGDTLEIVSPRCRDENNICFTEHEFLKEQGYCVSSESSPSFVMSRLRNLNSQFKFLTPLQFGEKCNFRDHNRFFTYSKDEDANFQVRVENLEDIQRRGTKFCDLQKLLTCGPSGTCECISPTSRETDKCVLPAEFDLCSLNLKLEPILMNKSIIFSAREKLMTGFASAVTVKGCEGKLTCYAAMMEMYCTCPRGKTGQDCEETLTKFLTIVRVPSLPKDVSDYGQQVKIFSAFNDKAVKFQKTFKLGEGAACKWDTQFEAEMLVLRIRKLMYRGTTMSEKQYEELGKKIQNHITSQPAQGICVETLRCQYTTKKCVLAKRQNYLEDLRKELEKSKTLKCKEMGCSKFPTHLDVMFGGDKTEFYGGEHEMKYNEIIEKHSELLKSNSKFCSASGSCSGSSLGTCVCKVGDQNKGTGTDNMSTTVSLAHYCHLPNRFILLFSFALFFLVSNC